MVQNIYIRRVEGDGKLVSIDIDKVEMVKDPWKIDNPPKKSLPSPHPRFVIPAERSLDRDRRNPVNTAPRGRPPLRLRSFGGYWIPARREPGQMAQARSRASVDALWLAWPG